MFIVKGSVCIFDFIVHILTGMCVYIAILGLQL